LLTSTIAYRLWKSRTGWHNTDKLIRKLLLYVSFLLERSVGASLEVTVLTLQYLGRDADATHHNVHPLLDPHQHSPVFDGQKLIFSALAVLVIFNQLPNSTAQLVVVFHPKIGVICLLFTLLSRVALAEMRQKQGSNALPKTFESNHSTVSAASSMGAIYFERDTGKLEYGSGGTERDRGAGAV
jgi:hypothetical protein